MKTSDVARILMIIFVLAHFVPNISGQQSGQTGRSFGTTSTLGSTATDQPQEMPVKVYFSGMVVREDGTPPPTGAFIELDCGDTITRQAEVDLNGSYTFLLGDVSRTERLQPDASTRMDDPFDRRLVDLNTAYPTSPIPLLALQTAQRIPVYQRLAACELRAQLPGYRSSRQKLIGLEITMVNNVAPLVVYPINRTKGTTVSATSMLAPKAAKRLMEQAQKAYQQRKLDVFESSLESAVAMYPAYGEAWLQLGQLYRKQKRYAEAGEALKKAIAVDALYVNPYVELGWLAAGERKWQEAADVTEKAVALDAVAFPEAYYLNALANFNMDKLDVAEKSARQARQLDPSIRLPHVFLILAAISAEKNDTSSAIEGYRNYLLHSPDAPDADSARKQLQELEDLAKAQTQK